MAHRVFVAATIASTVLMGLCLSLFVATICIHQLDASEHHLSITNDFHVGFRGGCIAFFSDAHGPYQGSIMLLVGSSPPRVDQAGFDLPLGIYYRYYRFWDSGKVVWTLMVWLLDPATIFSVLPVTWLLCHWRQSQRASKDSRAEGAVGY